MAQLDGCTSPGHSDPRVVAGSGAPPGKKPSEGVRGSGLVEDWLGRGPRLFLPRVSTVPSNQVTGAPCLRTGAGDSVRSHANLLQGCGPLHLLSSGILNLQQAGWDSVVTPLPPSAFPPPQVRPAGPVPPFLPHPSRPLVPKMLFQLSSRLSCLSLHLPEPPSAPCLPAVPPSLLPKSPVSAPAAHHHQAGSPK